MSLAFIFPGQGSQYLGMGSDLYRTNTVFRLHMDSCCDILAQEPLLGFDLRQKLGYDVVDGTYGDEVVI